MNWNTHYIPIMMAFMIVNSLTIVKALFSLLFSPTKQCTFWIVTIMSDKQMWLPTFETGSCQWSNLAAVTVLYWWLPVWSCGHLIIVGSHFKRNSLQLPCWLTPLSHHNKHKQLIVDLAMDVCSIREVQWNFHNVMYSWYSSARNHSVADKIVRHARETI